MKARPIGSPWKRPDGRFEATYIGADGKRRSGYGRTPKLSASDRDDKIARENGGARASDGRALFATVVQEVSADWLDDDTGDDITYSTAKVYSDLLRNRVVPMLGRLPIGEVQPSEIRAVYTHLRQQGLTTSTLRSVHAALRKLFKLMYHDQIIARNPMMMVDRPAPPKRGPQQEVRIVKAWQDDELVTVLAALMADDQSALWMFLLGTGVRISEALGLQWSKVDLSEGAATIDRARHRVGGRVVEGSTKTHREDKPAELPDALVVVLRKHQSAMKRQRMLLGEDWVDSGLVFVTPIGTALDDSNQRHRFNKIVEDAGVVRPKGKSIHSLRATYVSSGLAAGNDLTTMASLVGHAKTTTTELYAFSSKSRRRDAAAKIGTALFG